MESVVGRTEAGDRGRSLRDQCGHDVKLYRDRPVGKWVRYPYGSRPCSPAGTSYLDRPARDQRDTGGHGSGGGSRRSAPVGKTADFPQYHV
jgi:hypothetical protein